MLTDQEIQDLIRSPKEIKEKIPIREYKEENGHRRCNLKLETIEDEEVKFFSVFIRQNSFFLENFSIGLRYQTNDRMLGSVTLVRYNGPHGETSRSQDGHYAKPHIHRITAQEIESGSIQPQESHRENTDRYNTLEEALSIFFSDVGVINYSDYFPELLQRSLFQ